MKERMVRWTTGWMRPARGGRTALVGTLCVVGFVALCLAGCRQPEVRPAGEPEPRAGKASPAAEREVAGRPAAERSQAERPGDGAAEEAGEPRVEKPRQPVGGAGAPPAFEGMMAGAPRMAELEGATFSGILPSPVPLSEGRWENDEKRVSVGLVEDFLLEGDLDGDGGVEAVVLLWESDGGSGTVSHLAAARWWDGEIVTLAAAEIGDRVQVRGGRVTRPSGGRGGRVELDVVQAGPEDPMCCPGEKAVRVWELRDGALVELEPEVTGRLSMADLEGTVWRLTHFTGEEPAPEAPPITLQVVGSELSGQSACNRYFGEVGPAEGGPGQIEVGRVGSTRRGCPADVMQLERRYLAALGSVSGFSFRGGHLALTYRQDGGVRTLLFEAERRMEEEGSEAGGGNG